MKAFKAYDIRGIFGVDFTAVDAYKIGFFIPELLNTTKVLVGRDIRNSSDEIHQELIKGICDAGADVYDAGLTTTPMIYWATAKFDFEASVQITASHNPREYNGMKISGKNALPVGYDSGLSDLERWIEQKKIIPKEIGGQLISLDFKTEYIHFQKQYLSDLSQLSMVVDCSNGMAGLLIKDILGDQPKYLYDTPDGDFPNHDPNPLELENVKDLQQMVLAQKADIGVIFDGDADRVMFVDELGKFIPPDLIIALLGNYFLKQDSHNNKVLQDIRSSKSVAEYLEPMGAQMHTWKVGRAFAAEKLREIDGLFGGEYAGHYYFKDFYYSDSGIMAALVVLDIVSEKKKQGLSLSQMIAEISNYANSGEINFVIEEKQQAMDAVKAYFEKQEAPTHFYDFDGYRIEFNDWWLNIRPSNTEPYLRFLAEARTQEMLDKKIAEVRKVLKTYLMSGD
ncbi:MAG: phosphomannomutase/phosphoglucomutase [Bacteroidales bacterium]|nr:phosphomannomutase/phosphoglucomutase [Bacteroidales bacterium]